MSFRPQFAYPTPEDYEDEDFIEYFDFTSIPGLGAALAAGGEFLGIPLPLEPNEAYRIRAIEVSYQSGNPLGVRFQDPFGNYLSDDYVPLSGYSGGQGDVPGGLPVVFECEIVCPPGGIVTVDLKNLS